MCVYMCVCVCVAVWVGWMGVCATMNFLKCVNIWSRGLLHEAVSDHGHAKCSTVFLGTQTNEFGGLLVYIQHRSLPQEVSCPSRVSTFNYYVDSFQRADEYRVSS